MATATLLMLLTIQAHGQGLKPQPYGSVPTESNSFCIAKDGKTATIVVDENDWKSVIRAAKDLSDDVRKVCGSCNYLL